MAQKISGGCACGAVRYETDADPVLMVNCHCRDCQQAGGSNYFAARIRADMEKIGKVVREAGMKAE